MANALRSTYLIENLPWTVGSKQLKCYFIRFGDIESAWVNYDKETGLSNGTGYVTFSKFLKKSPLAQPNVLHGDVIRVRQIE